MRTLSILFVALVVAISALVACGSYDPNLPAVPFLCGSQTPMCPDGFACTDDGMGKMVCLKTNASLIDADTSHQFHCEDDSNLEPNDMISNAFSVNPEGQPGKTISFSGLAICPELDKDTYAVNITLTGENLEAIVNVDTGNPVSVAILNAGGSIIGVPMPMGSASRAYVANLPAGAFYAQVFAGASVKNNYHMKLTVSGP